MAERVQKLHPNDSMLAFTPRVPRASDKGLAADRRLVTDDAIRLASSFAQCVAEEMVKRKDDIAAAMEERGYDRGRKFLENEIPFRVNADAMIDRMRPAEIQYRAELLRKGGVGLHENQIRTLVAILIESSLELTKPGVVIGPMQSGKTGLSLAVALFMAPLMYQLAGVKFCPLFLSTHLDVHAEQTRQEFEAVLSLYGDLEIEVAGGRITPSDYYNLVNVMEDHYGDHASGFATEDGIDPVYEADASPRSYRNVIMRDKLTQSADDIQIVYNRRNGAEVAKLRKRMADLQADGFSLLLLIDEPQYGASGELTPLYQPNGEAKTDKFGRQKFKGVVIKQIMNDILDDLLSEEGKNMAIMVSATPFDTAEMAGTWTVRSYLSPNYIGYNCWAGSKIDETVWLRTPTLRSFSDVATACANDDINGLRNLLGAGKKSADFKRGAKALHDALDFLTANREDVADDVRFERPDLSGRLDDMLAGAFGCCIRFVSNNSKTDTIIRETRLEERFQVFRYYGGVLVDEDRRQTLTAQEVLDRKWDRNDPRPPLFVVTNLARMGDNFPRMIEHFVDLAQTAGDMNALLQGLNGRACGESKFLSQVMLSDDSVQRLRDYVSTLGLAVHKGSSHSLVVGGSVSRGRGHKMIRVTTLGNTDPLVARFFQLLNERIVWQRFSDDAGNRTVQTKLPAQPAPFYDINSILNEVRDDQGRDLIEYLSDPYVQQRVFPHMEYMDIANPLVPTTRVKLLRKDRETGERVPKMMGYDHHNGKTKLSFRTRPTDKVDAGHYGLTDREQRDRDTSQQTDRAVSSTGLEIQVNVLKRKSLRANAAEVMDPMAPGFPEAYMVTFPLTKEARPKTVVEGRPTTIAKAEGWIAPLSIPEEVAMQQDAADRSAALAHNRADLKSIRARGAATKAAKKSGAA